MPGFTDGCASVRVRLIFKRERSGTRGSRENHITWTRPTCFGADSAYVGTLCAIVNCTNWAWRPSLTKQWVHQLQPYWSCYTTTARSPSELRSCVPISTTITHAKLSANARLIMHVADVRMCVCEVFKIAGKGFDAMFSIVSTDIDKINKMWIRYSVNVLRLCLMQGNELSTLCNTSVWY